MDSCEELFTHLDHVSQQHDAQSVLAALKEATAKAKDDLFRNSMSKNHMLLLADILKSYTREALNKGGGALEVCVECIRCLRNACVQCEKNQDAVASLPSFVLFRELVRFVIEKEDPVEAHLILLRCCIQCLNNIASGHAGGQVLVWTHILSASMCSLLKTKDGKVAQYSCMLLQTCLLSPECLASFEESAAIADIIESTLCLCTTESEYDFSLQLLQMLLMSATSISQVFERLTISAQITLLDIATAYAAEETDKPQDLETKYLCISEGTLMCFAHKFKTLGHHILSLAMNDSDRNDQNPRLVMSLLECLCSASAEASLQPHIQNMDIVLETSLELLNTVEQVGRSSDNAFSVSQDFDALARDGAGHEEPGYGFKRNLVQLIGNLCFRHRRNQDRVRELKGIPTILQQCNIDSKNAFINQWAILAIRNLCDDNLENQAYLASLQNQGVADNEALSRLGFEAVQREDGQVYLKNIKKK